MKTWHCLFLASIALLSLIPKTTDFESSSIAVIAPANTANAVTPTAVQCFPYELNTTESTKFDSVFASQQVEPRFTEGSKVEVGIPPRVPMTAWTTSLAFTAMWLSTPSASFDEHQLDGDCLFELRRRPRWTVARTPSLRFSPASLFTLHIRLQV